MKLKRVASLCKSRKTVYIYTNRDTQYVGNGSACYLVPEELTLDKDNVLIIFDVPKDKRDCWMVEATDFLEGTIMADVLEGEEQAQIYPVDLCCCESTYRIIKDQKGIAMIDTKYLAPLTEAEIELGYYIRRTDEGKEYIAVKRGLMLEAVIAASNPLIINQLFLDNLKDLQRECSQWMAHQHKEGDDNGMQLHIDPETGEVKEKIGMIQLCKSPDIYEREENR